jgi:hypothetical protein
MDRLVVGVLALLGTLAFVALLILTFSPQPVVARECESIEDVKRIIAERNGRLIAIVDVPGTELDQVIIAEYLGGIVIGKAFNGCSVGPPVGIGSAKDRGTPA